MKCCKLVQHVLCQNVLCYNWSDGQNSGVGRPSSLLFQSLILFDFNHHGNGQRGGERGCNCKVRVVSVQQEGIRLRSGLTGGSAADRELQRDKKRDKPFDQIINTFIFLILCPFCSCTMFSSLAVLFLCLHQTVWGQQQTGEPQLFSIHCPSSLPPNSADRWMFLAASPHFCSSLTSCSRLKAPILSCFTTLSHHVAARLCNLRHQQATKNSAGFSEWQQIDVFCTFFGL